MAFDPWRCKARGFLFFERPDRPTIRCVGTLSTLFLSVLTLGELRKSIAGVSDAKRRLALTDWLETDLPVFFAGRILSVDSQVTDRWGRLVATVGRPLPAIDSLLGATAAQHGLSMVTSNMRDFADIGPNVINP